MPPRRSARVSRVIPAPKRAPPESLLGAYLEVSASNLGYNVAPHSHAPAKEVLMVVTAAHISPLIALIAGILILIVPQLLNYVIAIYLIVVGLIGLNEIYHFIT
jgi:hypothetical protein